MSPGDTLWGPVVPAPGALGGCPGLRPTVVMRDPSCAPPPKIAAMRAGLLRVVPQPVLDLLTWQQLEKKVCGDPEITVAELRRFSKCRGQPKAVPRPLHGQGTHLMMLVLHTHLVPC